jgi:hypothetical protein
MVAGTLTVAKIVELAFSTLIEVGVGKLGEKATEAVLSKINQLYQKIRTRLWGNPQAEAAIVGLEQQQTTDLEPITQCLQAVMADDPDFAQEIRQLAQEIVNIGTVDGNVQNILQGDGYMSIDNQGQAFQGGSHTINIHYNNLPST